MVGAFLATAGALWAVAGLAGLAVSLLGVQALEGALPPLAIADDALGRTVAALGIGALLVGLVHGTVVWGMTRGRPWAPSAGLLLAGVSLASFVALGTAAATAGAAGSLGLTPAIIGALGAVLMAIGYGAAAVTLAHRLRSRPPI